MAIDLYEIALAIAPSITQRTLENLRRTLEELYIKSTAQGATQADRDAFNAEMVAKAHLMAQRDNAKTIASWAKAIRDELLYVETQNAAKESLELQLATQRDKLAYYNRELDAFEADQTYQTLTAEEREPVKARIVATIQHTSQEVFRLSQALRVMPSTDLGRTPQSGPWAFPAGDRDLDGGVPKMP